MDVRGGKITVNLKELH